MKFNKAKCKVLHVGQSNPEHGYSLGNEWIQSNPRENDAGVLVDEKLGMTQHCALASQKTKEHKIPWHSTDSKAEEFRKNNGTHDYEEKLRDNQLVELCSSSLNDTQCGWITSNTDSGIAGTLRKFANDTKVCGAIYTLKGRDAIEKDLDRLVCANLMNFNKTKCKVLHMGQSNLKHKYRLGRERIESPEDKDVGVLHDEKHNKTQQS
ncbi:hypothetical protein BTVI_42786 [Pitangus sulphuratus]|nr:hypothetical protein BTVI_42786 [Pitangus sulphuratus]